MNIETILTIFGGLAGLSEDEVIRFRFLCEMASDHLRERSRGGDEIGGSKWEFAAAALAYYRYVLWSMTDSGAGDIRVGEVSVRQQRERLIYAERLCREALAGLADELEDEGFVFERI